MKVLPIPCPQHLRRSVLPFIARLLALVNVGV